MKYYATMVALGAMIIFTACHIASMTMNQTYKLVTDDGDIIASGLTYHGCGQYDDSHLLDVDIQFCIPE